LRRLVLLERIEDLLPPSDPGVLVEVWSTSPAVPRMDDKLVVLYVRQTNFISFRPFRKS